MKHQNLGCAFVNDNMSPVMRPEYKQWDEGNLIYYINKENDTFFVKSFIGETFEIPMFSFSIDPYKFNKKSNQWPQWWLKSPFHGFPEEINKALEIMILHLCNSTNKKLKASTVSQAYIDALYLLDPLKTNDYIGAIYYNKDNENIIHDAYMLADDKSNMKYNLERIIHPVNNFQKNCFGFSPEADFFGVLATKNEKTFGVACTNNFVLVELE